MFQLFYNLIIIISFIVGATILVTQINESIIKINDNQILMYNQPNLQIDQSNKNEEEQSEIDKKQELKNKLKGKHQEIIIEKEIVKTITGNNKIYRNIYVPNQTKITEIDILFITPMGIYVIESKNYDANIYGYEKNLNWLAFYHGKKYIMPNPIIQNRQHIKYLKKYLKIPEKYFKSIIVFNDNANLYKVPKSCDKYTICYLRNLNRTILNLMIEYDHSIKDININQIKKDLAPIINASDELKEKHKIRIKNKYE